MEKWRMSKPKEALTEFFRWLWEHNYVDDTLLFEKVEPEFEDCTGNFCTLDKYSPVFGKIVEKYLKGEKLERP
jgi:hypothetical protein